MPSFAVAIIPMTILPFSTVRSALPTEPSFNSYTKKGCRVVNVQYDGGHRWQALAQNCEERLLVSSCLSVYNSIYLHGRFRLPLDRFSWNLNRIFCEICRENPSFVKMTRITRTLHEDQDTFMIQGGSNMTGTDFFFVTIIAHHSSNSQTGLNRF